MSRSKGSRYERQLVGIYSDEGWYAQRIQASGSGTENELPDIIAAKEGLIHVIELKFTSKGQVYVQEEKVNGLQWLATQLGATPFITARFKGDTTYYAFLPQDCERTSSGTHVIRESMRDSDEAFVLP